MKKVSKISSFLLVLAMMFNISASAYAYAVEEANREKLMAMDQQERMLADLEARGVVINHVTDNTLISNIKNTKNGVLTFTVKIPAGQTLYYTVKLVPNDRTGSINTAVDTSYKNTTSSTVTKQITANVKYFSDMYTISASYTTGNSREKTVHECEKTAISKLVMTVYSTKFVWDDANVAKWKAGEAVKWTFTIGANKVLAEVAKKFVAVPSVSIPCGVIVVALDIGLGLESMEPSRTTDIMYEAKLGWGYQLKFEPTSNGYRTWLITFNDNGGIADKDDLGIMNVSGISYVIK